MSSVGPTEWPEDAEERIKLAREASKIRAKVITAPEHNRPEGIEEAQTK